MWKKEDQVLKGIEKEVALARTFTARPILSSVRLRNPCISSQRLQIYLWCVSKHKGHVASSTFVAVYAVTCAAGFECGAPQDADLYPHIKPRPIHWKTVRYSMPLPGFPSHVCIAIIHCCKI